MSAIKQILGEALSDAEAWTYRATVPFEIGRVATVKKRAYRLGDINDVYIERDDVEGSAVRMVNGTKQGVISKLVAGTGTGKSTKVPVVISVELNCVGVVLCPTANLAATVSEFVAKSVVSGRNVACNASYVTNYAAFKKLVKPAVAYMGVNEFLVMLAGKFDIFEKHKIGYVYVDEAHERIPAYAVLRLLVSVDVFKNTKVFMGSATSSGQNMEARSISVKHIVKTIKPVDMQYDDVGAITDKSPLFYGAITVRTLIFLPAQECFPVLADYYESNAVHVRCLTACASKGEIQRLNSFLSDVSYAVVVLATPAHQTGYTFAIDVVIDCGVTAYLDVDLESGALTKHDRVVTEFERVQRCGRVGRHLNGRAYCVDGEPAGDGFELYSGSEMYVALWCKVFDIDVSMAYLSKWITLVSEMSVDCAKVLLCSRVHPMLLYHYLDNDGKSYRGSRSLFRKLLGSTQDVESSGRQMTEDMMSGWLTKRLKGEALLLYSADFLAPCEVPTEWLPICSVLYHGLTGGDLKGLLEGGSSYIASQADGASDVSQSSFVLGNSTVVSVAKRPSAAGSKSAADRELFPSDSVSMAGSPLKLDTVPLPEYSSQVGARSRKSSSKSQVVANVDAFARMKLSSPRSSYADDIKVLRGVETKDHHISRDEVADVGKSLEYKNRESKRDSGIDVEDRRSRRESGGSSKSKAVVKVKSISAKNLSFERIKPRDLAMLDMFRTLRVDDRQRKMYEKLKMCIVEIATLQRRDMDKYFLATLLTWNRTVSNYSQFKAAPYTGLLSNLRNNRMFDDYNTSLRVCRGFLETFEHHGFKICLYEGIEQTGLLISTPKLEEARAAAECAVQIISLHASEAVSSVAHRMCFIRLANGHVGQYLVDGDRMFMVDHVFTSMIDGEIVLSMPRHDIRSLTIGGDGRLYKYRLSSFANSVLRYREARLGESVIVVAYLSKSVPEFFGVYEVLSAKGMFVYDGLLSDGMSGAPLVAIDDGAVIGFHNGRCVYNVRECSEFISVA